MVMAVPIFFRWAGFFGRHRGDQIVGGLRRRSVRVVVVRLFSRYRLSRACVTGSLVTRTCVSRSRLPRVGVPVAAVVAFVAMSRLLRRLFVWTGVLWPWYPGNQNFVALRLLEVPRNPACDQEPVHLIPISAPRLFRLALQPSRQCRRRRLRAMPRRCRGSSVVSIFLSAGMCVLKTAARRSCSRRSATRRDRGRQAIIDRLRHGRPAMLAVLPIGRGFAGSASSFASSSSPGLWAWIDLPGTLAATGPAGADSRPGRIDQRTARRRGPKPGKGRSPCPLALSLPGSPAKRSPIAVDAGGKFREIGAERHSPTLLRRKQRQRFND